MASPLGNHRAPVVGDLVKLFNGNEYRVLKVQSLAEPGTYLLNGYEIDGSDNSPTLKPYELVWPLDYLISAQEPRTCLQEI
jgi:hypothetical protein